MSSEDRALARIGAVIAGKYELQRLLGVGSTGAVYEAVHRFTGRSVAVKVLHETLLESPEHVARFLREARAASALGHPALVAVFDAGRAEDGSLYLVQELLHGEDLWAAMSHGELTTGDIVDVGIQLLEGLAAAHARGIVHRDIKPDNVFLTRGERGELRVKVLDFGIAKHPLADSPTMSITLQGMTVGTPYYMSPEQARAAPVDARADLWSVGAMLFHVLAGVPPFDDASVGGLLAKIVTSRAPSLKSVRPELPDSLCQVIDRALEPDRNRRWQTADLMAQELRGSGAPVDDLDWDDDL